MIGLGERCGISNDEVISIRSRFLYQWHENRKLHPWWSATDKSTWTYDLDTRLSAIVANAEMEATFIGLELIEKIKNDGQRANI